MEKVIKLLAELRAQQIKLILKGNDLEVVSYKNQLQADQIQKIKSLKDEIILYLKSIDRNEPLNRSSIPKVKSESDNYPLSNAQYRLWLTSQTEESSVVYNIPATVVLDGDYDMAYFEKAIHAVIERHEILRTVFRVDNLGEVRQYIQSSKEMGFSIGFKDFRKEEDPVSAYQTYISSDSHKPFDLVNGPLLRADVLQYSDKGYILYFNMHHIISDEGSMKVLSNDILKYYEAYASGTDPDISPLEIQYKDYASWQLDQLNSPAFQEHKDYWFSQFRDDVAVIDLPTGKRRSNVKTYKGKRIGTRISPEITSQIRDFSAKRRGSLFMGLLAAWKVLIHRYTGETDITIGNPTSERNYIGLEEQIGFYVNVLPLRNKINPEHNFVALFDQIRENTLNAYKHQMYPFDKLLENLDLTRDTSRSPLFDIKIDYHGASESMLDVDKDQDLQDLGDCMVKFDLEIDPREVKGGIDLVIKYNSDVYEHEMIEKLIIHYKNLMQALLDAPDKNINEIEYLSEAEKNQLLYDFNDTVVDYPKDETVVDLFLDQVQKTPDAIAVVFEETKLTYKQLDEKSNQLAHLLITENDIKRKDFIGIHLDVGVDYIIAILGILKAGGVYVPIDTKHPSGRKKYLIENSSIEVVITDTSYMFEVDFFEGNILAIDVELDSGVDSSLNINLANAEDLAYVLYTSGSTGVPKGVMIEHRNLLDYSYGLIEALKLDTPYSYGLMSTPSADLGNTVLFGSLVTGGTLHTFSKETVMDVFTLNSYFNTNDVDIIKIVPSHWFSLCSGDIVFLPKKAIVFGGEKLTDRVINKIKKQESSIEVFNHYGPTETTIGKLIHKLDLDRNYVNIPIGKTFSNAGVYILDKKLNLLPIGAVGELYIDGAGLARGYLNSPEMTAEKFIAHPFKADERIYNTGDLARWSQDGNVEFMGRADDQVKIRGHRVEVKEIESILNQIEYINQSVVLAKKDNHGTVQLIAYIVSEEEGLDIPAIQNNLKRSLPEYMIPNLYEEIEEIPLTANGKINYKALPNPSENKVNQQEYVAPKSPKEIALVAVCESVLKKEKISIKDDFYQLGGDSIKSIQVVARIRQHGFVLKVGDILGTPVLEEMTSLMQEVSRSIDQSEVEGDVVLTPIQQHLLDNPQILVPQHFNQSVILESEHPLNPQVLDSSVGHLVKHHDALRMVYQQKEGNWKQFNQKYSDDCYRIDFHDLREDEDAVTKMGELCQMMQSGFDLTTGPLFVVGHFSLVDGDRLVLICHHLVIDGISWRILLEDLSSLYNQYKLGGDVALPLKTDSFQSWASLQEQHAKSSLLKGERKYWEGVLNQSIPTIPVDQEVKDETLNLDKQVSFSLDKDLVVKMQTQINKVYNTEINDVLLTALGLAIRDVLGVSKSVLNMEGHGRENIIDGVDISRTIGWFTTHYPVVLEVSESEDSTRSLIKVKDNIRTVPNKGIGYGMLKYLTEGFSNELKRTINFNFLGDFGSNNVGSTEADIFKYGSEYTGDWKDKNNKDDILLNVSGMIVSEVLSMSIFYCSESYDEQRMKALMDAYQNHLTTLIEELSDIKETYLTPSDLIYSDLELEDLEVLNSDGLLENIYQLSPAQKGIYFHWLSSDDPRLYLTQISFRVKSSSLNAAHFKKAFDELVARYDILRTSFTSQYNHTLLQVVKKEVPSYFASEKSPENIDSDTLNAWMAKRKESNALMGFNLEDSSQMRLLILELEDSSFELVWSFHHIIMDGWCISILMNDFYEILSANTNNVSLNLTAPKPYSDYIQWLNNVKEEETLTYWKNYLSGYTSNIEIPFKVSNLSNSSDEVFKNLVETVEISGDLYENITALCNNAGVTQYTFMQVVWGYLMSRYNDAGDIVFGSVVSGRPPEINGVEDMVGIFMNTIPVRIKFEDNETLVDILKKTQRDAIAGLSHHYLDLATVQGQSELGKSLINHLLVFENYPIQDLVRENFEGKDILELESTDFDKIQMNYDFSIVIKTSPDSLTLDFCYNGNKYEASLIKRMGTHFQKVVDLLMLQPDQHLNRLDYLSKEEKKELLEVFNDTKVNYPLEQTVISLFEKQAENTPDTIAVDFEGKSLTYKELDERSNQLAQYLQKQGVSKETLVPICLDRSLEMIIGVLAVLKAGGAYVPIDPTYPQQRIDFVLEDTAANLILTTKSLKEQFENYQPNLQVVYLDKLSELLKDFSANPVDDVLSPTQLAYVIYTSGSSGTPKGVKTEHKALLNFLFSMRDYLNFDEHLKLLSLTTFTFDISILEFLSPLLLGGKLILISDADSKDPKHLSQFIKETNPSCIQATPSHWQMFINEDWGADQNLTLITGGEAVSYTLKEQLLNKSDKVWNLYGPTETTIWSSICRLEKGKKVTIGKPIANTQIYILNDDLSLAPLGKSGEICIGGLGLSRGYLNQPELTQEKFAQNPFNLEERIYRTGDLGRWLPDGNIEFFGRKDNQVKIRGHRIELGEIENVLSSKEEINTVAVVVKESESGDKNLVAYYTSSNTLDLSSLRLYLQQRLPLHMVPNYFVELNALPLTANSKIDRKALPDHKGLGLTSSKEYVEARNETEKILVSIWEELLERKCIGVKDDFFDLGGHSLKVISLINEYHKVFDVKLTIEDIFNNSRLETHVDLLSSSEKSLHTVIPVTSKRSSYPMSDAQRRLWVMSQFEGGNISYNIYSSISLVGNYDIVNFKKSLLSVLDRHEILRTVFRENDQGTVSQVILDTNEIGFEIGYEDYRKKENPQEFVWTYLKEDSSKPFDLENGPLLRISLLQLSDTDYVLYFNMHHIISDGWSLEVLSKEVLSYYEHYSTGIALNVPELRIQYKDYASWQLAQLDTDEYKVHKDYWLDKFSGNLPLLDLPTHKLRPSLRTYNGKHLTTCWSKEDTALMKEYTEDKGTLFMFLVASLKVLLYRYTKEEDIIIGSPVAGRGHLDLENQIGFYANTLPIRSKLNGAVSFNEFFIKVKQELLEAYTHQMYPFDRLVEDLDLRRDIGRSALFDVLVVLQGEEENESAGEFLNKNVELIRDLGEVKSKLDVEFIFKEIEGHLRLDLTYNTDVYDNEMMSDFMTHYLRLVKLLASENKASINELNYLLDSEREELLLDFNKTSVGYPDNKTVINLFEEQVLKTPDNVALVYNDEKLTYKEVDELSNQLAHCLDAKKIKTPYVGVILERSVWSAISMIAVIKLGKVYVPVDFNYPKERIEYILRDANITHVVGDLNLEIVQSLDENLYDVLDVKSLDKTKTYSRINNSNLTEDAFVIYTSGSTGKPKGVIQTHEMLKNLVTWDFSVAGVKRDLKCLQYSSFSFDVSLQDVFGALSNGGELHIASEKIKLDFISLKDYILNESIEVLAFPYAAMAAFFNVNSASDLSGNKIEQIIAAGEQLVLTEGLNEFLDFNPLVELQNHYGPSETHVVTSYTYRAANDIYKDRKDVLIGKPVNNTTVYILNDAYQLQPKLVTGEIYIGGSGLASGYLNLDDLTNTRFLDDPFTKGARMYKTGDLGRWLPDGNIEYLGRKDDQVKIRGYRIELGEIESTLDQLKNIQKSVVLAKEDGKGNKQLVAYILSDKMVNGQSIRDTLRGKLPEYMIPWIYMKMEQMPLTSNGKVDRKALPDPDMDAHLKEQYEAPSSELEIQLVEVWQEVLGREKIGVKDHFFELGGNSLDIIKVIPKIRKKLDLEIDIQTLFQVDTIRDLAFQINFTLNQKAVRKEHKILNEIKL